MNSSQYEGRQKQLVFRRATSQLGGAINVKIRAFIIYQEIELSTNSRYKFCYLHLQIVVLPNSISQIVTTFLIYSIYTNYPMGNIEMSLFRLDGAQFWNGQMHYKQQVTHTTRYSSLAGISIKSGRPLTAKKCRSFSSDVVQIDALLVSGQRLAVNGQCSGLI